MSVIFLVIFIKIEWILVDSLANIINVKKWLGLCDVETYWLLIPGHVIGFWQEIRKGSG